MPNARFENWIHKLDKSKVRMFQNALGSPLNNFIDTMMLGFTGKCQLDICKLDNWLQSSMGYSEIDHGSMQDFLILKPGKELAEFVESLV